MKRLRAACFGLLALFFLAGCAATAPMVDKREPVVAAHPADEQMATARPGEDRDLFLEGSAFLNAPGEPDPAKARAVFAALIQRYPRSRWRPAAENFIRLIDENKASRETVREEQHRREKLGAEMFAALEEKEALKKTVRELKERLQTETAALSQENEKLKTDLQRLKTLEIELEKRERMLR